MTETTLPMTRARWTILAVGVPVALAMIAVCARAWVFGAINSLANLSPISRSVAFSAPTRPDGVHLTMTDGNLTFHTGTGRRIRVQGTLKGSLAAPTFSHQMTPTGLILNPTCRAPVGTCDVSLWATGPAGLPVDIDDSFGQLDTSALRGNITLSSNSGNITASRLAGSVRLNDSFGDINVTGVSGTIAMSSNSGDITAAGLTGDTQLADTFGDINVTGISAADVRCTSQSGDVTIVFSTVPKHVQVTDSFGDVILELPSGSAVYRVQTKNPFGSTNVSSVPRSPTAQNTITVINNSGNITITSQGTSGTARSRIPRLPPRNRRRAGRARDGSGSVLDQW